jgi:hypothetical protein
MPTTPKSTSDAICSYVSFVLLLTNSVQSSTLHKNLKVILFFKTI